MTNCLNFLGTRWLWSCNRPIFQAILIFCRWYLCNYKLFYILSLCVDIADISKLSLCRFLYVRYASGLVKDGISLLHQLAYLYFAVYCTNWSLLFFFHFLSNYENFLKIKFCAQHNVTVLIEEDFTANSLKPKMILIATGLLFLTCLTFSYASALKSR